MCHSSGTAKTGEHFRQTPICGASHKKNEEKTTDGGKNGEKAEEKRPATEFSESILLAVVASDGTTAP